MLNGAAPANTPAIRVDTLPGTIWRDSGGGYVITQLTHYKHLSVGLAAVVRQQLPQLQSLIAGFGPWQSISFRRVEPKGADVYDIRFANGNTKWHILLGADGIVESEGLQPIPWKCRS